MNLRGVSLDSTQPTAHVGIAKKVTGNGNQAMAHEVDGEHETPYICEGHHETFDRGELETIGDRDIY